MCFFRDDMEEFIASNVLTTYSPVFSRDDPEAHLRYVQHAIQANQEDFVKTLFKEGEESVLYVCGDARNMAKDVNEVVIKCTADVLGNARKSIMF